MIVNHSHLNLGSEAEWRQQPIVLTQAFPTPRAAVAYILDTFPIVKRKLIRRVLLWLQRDYLAGRFPDYDPTSSRDEDLPIDLDHLIPNSKFGFDWRSRTSSLNFDDPNENFRHLRGTVGNSLGNFRWLDASDNRSRQANKINGGEGERDIIMNVSDWNALIGKKSWAEDDVATFQKMIDLRTITIYEHLLITGGLKDFVTEPVTVSNESLTI
jgi:hypothetical protein